ncbi:4030_t:CDS:2 [Funneliformis mosseae]|uniref:4030_t:CDS:1 n=1 Tax=Funneliformis mosseae TaxID=27381 RepID=A0A9N9B2T7_FUNMO|nr:4030_t:CDS:2 [Funneliformis mosseae]
MKIKGGGLQTLVKMHWESLFMTIDALLRAQPVFDWAALVAIEIWQSLSHTYKESEELMAQLHRFKSRIAPFELSYISSLESPKLW